MSEVSPRTSLTATGIEVCNRGLVREENQDNVRTASLPIGELFIVADGIGGYQGGAIASQMVVDGFHSQLAIKPPNYPAQDALQEACTYTNSSIHQKAMSGDPATQRMGSTVVMALIQTGGSVPMAWVGHVGDSRAYLIRGGRMSKITSDHSAVQALLSRNLITEEEARNHPDSSVLTRSLGHRPEVEIEVDAVPLQAGDALLLCSDGLWGYVAEGDIESVVKNPSLAMDTVGELLLRLALDAGGHDNIGIQYIRISGSAPTTSAPLPATFPPVASGSPAQVEAGRQKSARKLQMAAIGLLLLGGLGTLGIVYRDKFRAIVRPNPLKVALVGEQKSKAQLQVQHTASNGKVTWILSVLPKREMPSCAVHASASTKMYADGTQFDHQALVNEVSAQAGLDDVPHQINTDGSVFEALNPDILKDCGAGSIYNVVIVMHHEQPPPAHDTERETVQPRQSLKPVKPVVTPGAKPTVTPDSQPPATPQATQDNRQDQGHSSQTANHNQPAKPAVTPKDR